MVMSDPVRYDGILASYTFGHSYLPLVRLPHAGAGRRIFDPRVLYLLDYFVPILFPLDGGGL